MKNIFRFMKGFGCYIFIILVLLVFQAYCDLSLPNYTSDILNVGLQQNGIESAVPKTVRADTLKALGLFISDDDFAIVDAAYEAPDEEKNFTTLLELINASEAREDDESFKNAVDLMFEDLAEREPDHFAVRQYAKYKLAAGVISLKRLLNHYFLGNWSSKMIKKSLEAYFLPQERNCTFLKTFCEKATFMPLRAG